MPERVSELVAAATDELFRRGEEKLVGVADGIAGFACGLVVDENLASHDSAFGLLAAFTNAAIHQRLIYTSHAEIVATAKSELTNYPNTRADQTVDSVQTNTAVCAFSRR